MTEHIHIQTILAGKNIELTELRQMAEARYNFFNVMIVVAKGLIVQGCVQDEMIISEVVEKQLLEIERDAELTVRDEMLQSAAIFIGWNELERDNMDWVLDIHKRFCKK